MVLKAENVTKVYGGKGNSSSTQALNGINICIEKGEFVGVMGPSGSGKTTLLNLLSGIDRITSGLVEVNGKNINRMEKNELAIFRRKSLGFVFQEFNLLDSLTLRENIMLPLILDKRPSREMEYKSREIMQVFDILDIENKYPYNVSGGQQQRAAVARALINDPVIVFADEPTGNLDSRSSKSVMQCMMKMNKEQESTILMVTHDPFAASYCKRVIFIKDGTVNMEIVSKGERKEFFEHILDCLSIMGGESGDI